MGYCIKYVVRGPKMYQHIFTSIVLAHLLLNSSLFYFLFDVLLDIVLGNGFEVELHICS